jgi:hypothetical protein
LEVDERNIGGKKKGILKSVRARKDIFNMIVYSNRGRHGETVRRAIDFASFFLPYRDGIGHGQWTPQQIVHSLPNI